MPAIPLPLDIFIKQGDSYHSGMMQFKRDGVIATLEGATGKCQIRNDPSSGVVLELVVGTVNRGEELGWWYWLEQTKELTATIPAPKWPYTEYYQDIQFTWASGYRETFTKGTCYVEPEVTV